MVDGLIHISQIANHRIARPSSVLSVGEEIEAKIIDIDFEKQKISLSRKMLLPDYVEEPSSSVEDKEKVLNSDEEPLPSDETKKPEEPKSQQEMEVVHPEEASAADKEQIQQADKAEGENIGE